LKKIILFTIISALALTVSITSISAQSQSDIPVWVKGVADFWVKGNISDSDFGESISFLIEQDIIHVDMPDTKDSETVNKIMMLEINNRKLEIENKNLKNEISVLESKNKRLQNTADNSKSSSPNNLPTHNEIRYDFDNWNTNIGGLVIDVYSFGFLEPKPDEFSIDMGITYARNGMVEFEVSQVRVTTDNHFSYETNKDQFLKFNGYYQSNEEHRGIVRVDDVPRELKGDFEILVLVREIENGYYIKDSIFTFPTTLQ